MKRYLTTADNEMVDGQSPRGGSLGAKEDKMEAQQIAGSYAEYDGGPTPKQSELVEKISRLDMAASALLMVTGQIEELLRIPNSEANLANDVGPSAGPPTLLMQRLNAMDIVSDRLIAIDNMLHRIMNELQNY